jgi:hypothetical protein
MERALVAQHVANKLFATENAIDQAIADASALVGELVKARQELGVSAVFADASFAQATAALAALGQARSAVVAAHNDLAESKLRVGIRTKLAGTSDKPPAQQQASLANLREVG